MANGTCEICDGPAKWGHLGPLEGRESSVTDSYEEICRFVLPLPLDVLVAMTEGLLQAEFAKSYKELKIRGDRKDGVDFCVVVGEPVDSVGKG